MTLIKRKEDPKQNIKLNLTTVDFIPNGSFLVFLRLFSKIGTNKTAIYKCTLCGKEREMIISKVKCGDIKSCGCLSVKKLIERSTTHGLTKHPLYTVWVRMICRCYVSTATHFSNYGGRGVKICEEWRHDFKAFYDWAILNGWKKGLQIDKDIKAKELGVPALLYSPERCQFVTPLINSGTKKNTRYIEYKGETKSLCEWCRHLNIPQNAMGLRFNKGWSVEKAFTTPLKPHKVTNPYKLKRNKNDKQKKRNAA